MSSKVNTEVIIGGRIYTLSGYDSEEYMQRIAAHINSRLSELRSSDGYKKLSGDDQNIVLNINLADDYFKAKKQADSLESEIARKEQKIYDLKHELIASNLKAEELEKKVTSLNEKISGLEKDVVRLETELKDRKNK